MTETPRTGPEASRGFSLLETMVAVVILSLSLAALYQAAAGAVRNVLVSGQYSRAAALAETLLASNSFVTDPAFRASGVFDEFTWEVVTRPASSDIDSGNSDGETDQEIPRQAKSLQFLQVWVKWQGPRGLREVDLLTVVPLRESTE